MMVWAEAIEPLEQGIWEFIKISRLFQFFLFCIVSTNVLFFVVSTIIMTKYASKMFKKILKIFLLFFNEKNGYIVLFCF